MLLLIVWFACAPKVAPETERAAGPRAPDAEQRAHVHTEHGVERSDPYYWMRDREDPAVIDYLEAENTYTEQRTAHTAAWRESLASEMLGRIQESDLSVPYKDGEWFYYRRTEEGKAYPIHCRKKGEDGQEEVILDENLLAEGHDYLDVGSWQVSPDHRLLAYSTDHTGREKYTVHFLDLETGEALPDTIEDIGWNFAFADNQTVFYTTLDDALRPHAVWRYTLGGEAPTQVYQEDDTTFTVNLWRTLSDAYMVLELDSTLTSEVHVLPTADPMGDFQVLSPRHAGHLYGMVHQGDRFVFRTNDCDDEEGKHADCAMNFKLMEAPLDATSRAEWTELIPHRDDVTLDGVLALKDALVVLERENGVVDLSVVPADGEPAFRVTQPDAAYTVYLSNNAEYETSTLRFWYTSMVTPWSVVDFDLARRDRTVRKVTPVLGDFDPGLYVTRRVMCPARDGVEVPMSLVHRADLAPGPQPTLLYAYGSYGYPMDASFSATRLSLLDRGMVFALAHVRGGGDLGRGWYEDGKLLRKKNTFTDFIDCAEHLVAEGVTVPEKLAIEGGSAGGLLVGAVVNLRPELFAAAHAAVPFVDVVTTMLDESIPLTTGEWDEWGDPRQREFFDYMLSYSPYDNVAEADYPALLITSGLNDPRVQYFEPTKWTARLRDHKTDDSVLLLRTNMGAGHGGSSGRYGRLENKAFEHGFLMDQLGLGNTEPTRSTVVYLVRHAEKAKGDSEDPPLTEAGEARARELAQWLDATHFTGVHSTDTTRTRSTAGPIAAREGLEVQLYDHREAEALVAAVMEAGGNHLVVGHSNTTPALVGQLGGEPGDEIEPAEYDRLYRVVLTEGQPPTSTLVRYGEPFTSDAQ